MPVDIADGFLVAALALLLIRISDLAQTSRLLHFPRRGDLLLLDARSSFRPWQYSYFALAISLQHFNSLVLPQNALMECGINV